ncbi:MAG: hypothetical protein Q9181_002519 [Wetmoreana brouardii]
MGTKFRLALQNMAGENPDLELRPSCHSRGFNSTYLSDATSIAELADQERGDMATDLTDMNPDQYIQGFPLYSLVIGLMMAAFLLMIDPTILVTSISPVAALTLLGFYLNGPAGAITGLILALIRIPDARMRSGSKLSIIKQIDRLDLPACVLFAGSAVALLLALDWGGLAYSWDSATIVSLFWGASFSLCLFLAWEYKRGAHSMLPLSLFRIPFISCAAVTSILSYGGLYVIILYLPLWFQAVKVFNDDAELTLIVSKTGYYTPFMLAGSAAASVAAALMTTFTPSSSKSAWVGYQLLNGIGRGMMSQQPITAIQANLSKEQLSVGTALVIFCQNFGASVFISLGQTVFQNSLLQGLTDFAPELDARQVLRLGATNFRSLIPEASVPNVVSAYNKALTTNFLPLPHLDMKVILTGTTGFIGSQVLRFALLHPAITAIVALSRRSLPINHPKLTVIIQNDFLGYSNTILEACAGAEACIWSLGVARSPSAESNRRINLDYTIVAAETFANQLAPQLAEGKDFRFVYLSGMLTERDQARKLWFMSESRMIRGEVENKLMDLQKKDQGRLVTYVARPGGVLATNSLFPGLLEPLARAIAVDDLAVKMLDTAINGHKTQILEVDVLREEGKMLKKELLKEKR